MEIIQKNLVVVRQIKHKKSMIGIILLFIGLWFLK